MGYKILVEVSARHVHLCREDLDKLFGEGYELTVKKNLSQPGEFACEERIAVVGPKRELTNVSILGPLRAATQVEISLTDARSIGLEIPVRESGDTKGSTGCKLVGPKGSVEIEEGVIAAKRHIHMTEESAIEAGVKNKQIVNFKIETKDRTLTFGDVVVRVKNTYSPAMHIDTDEGNAAGITGEVFGEIVG